MVRPVTNCLPSRRMARSTPLRINGSPPLRNRELTAASSAESLRESTSCPVTSSPQAAALTNSDGLRPMCARQSPPPILSRIRRSRVATSGIAQQRLGEAHQGDAFARIERKLEHQRVDARGAGARRAHALARATWPAAASHPAPGARTRLREQRLHGRRFVGTMKGRDSRARWVRQRVACGKPKRGGGRAIHDPGSIR